MLIYVFALVPATIFDMKQGLAPNKLLIPPIIIEVILRQNVLILLITIGLYFGFVITQKFWDKYIGGADIKILLSIFYLIQQQIIMVINIAALIALIYAKITRQNRVRFVPFIILGLVITLVCN